MANCVATASSRGRDDSWRRNRGAHVPRHRQKVPQLGRQTTRNESRRLAGDNRRLEKWPPISQVRVDLPPPAPPSWRSARGEEVVISPRAKSLLGNVPPSRVAPRRSGVPTAREKQIELFSLPRWQIWNLHLNRVFPSVMRASPSTPERRQTLDAVYGIKHPPFACRKEGAF